ncbi:MAG: hypothetical protein ACOH2D_10965 [Gelidibacter sp.]
MKTLKISALLVIFSISNAITAQTIESSNEAHIDNRSYYEKRAAEDAKFELEFSAKTKAEEEKFWKEQNAYEKELKRKNKKAYKAYIRNKKQAYAAHYERCNQHCHHSDDFYYHASFYHYHYKGYYYERQPRHTTTSTRVIVNTPSVRLGIF